LKIDSQIKVPVFEQEEDHQLLRKNQFPYDLKKLIRK